jgi:hypothetical protein
MANKTVSFLVKLDTSDVDGQIDKIKKKLTDAYRPGANAQSVQQTQQRLENMGTIPSQGGQSKAAKDAYEKSVNQSKIALDKRIAAEHKANVELQKQAVLKADGLKKAEQIQATLVKGSQAELGLAKEILVQRQNLSKLNDQIAAKDRIINEAADARQKMNQSKFGKAMSDFNSGRAGGLEGLMSGGGGQMAMLGGSMAIGAVVLGGISKAMTMAGNAYVSYNRIPLEVSQARGSAISNTYGKEIGAATAGSQSYEMTFMKEKQEAQKEAEQAQDAKMKRDNQLSIGGMMSHQHSLQGMVGSLFVGAFNDMLNSGSLAKDLTRLPGELGKSYSATYESQNMAEATQNYQQTQQSKRDTNPYKVQAADYFAQNSQSNLQLQRSMGMNDEQLTGQGGYFDAGAKQGFTAQQMSGMSGEILGAGGSSAMAKDSAFANRMARDQNLTNAGQVTGTLSGVLGGSKETEQATIKILAEGMRVGIIASEMPAEMNKFSQTVAEISSKAGAQSPEDVADKASQFSRFMGSNTMQGIEGAKSAFEQYQQRSASTSGAYGVLQASSFLQDKNLKGIDPESISALMSTEDQNLSPDNPKVRDAFNQARSKNPDLTMDDFMQSIRKAKDNTQSRNPELDQRRKRLQTYMKAHNIDKLDSSTIGKLDEGALADFDRINTLQENAAPGMNPMMAQSAAMGFVNGVPTKQTPEEQKAAEDRLNIPNAPRIGDEKNAADAATQADVLKSFRQFHEALVPSVETINQFNAALRRGIEAAQGTPSEKKTNQYWNSVMNSTTTGPENAPQAGSGKGGSGE